MARHWRNNSLQPYAVWHNLLQHSNLCIKLHCAFGRHWKQYFISFFKTRILFTNSIAPLGVIGSIDQFNTTGEAALRSMARHWRNNSLQPMQLRSFFSFDMVHNWPNYSFVQCYKHVYIGNIWIDKSVWTGDALCDALNRHEFVLTCES